MYIRCCDCLRESKSSALIRVLNSRETSAEAALIASFSVCPISISPPTDDQRERERDTSDKMKLWAIWATASINAKNFLFYATKTYFFYFTLSFLQNTHVNLSLYTFIQINIHFFNTVISLTDPTKPHSHLHQATTIIKPFNPTIWNPKTNNQTNNKKWIKTQKP